MNGKSRSSNGSPPSRISSHACSWVAFMAVGTISACKPAPPSGSTHAASAQALGQTRSPAPDHGSIDCPLREAGIDPHALKPFEDVEKYIAFLEKPDRAAWQKPDALVSSLALAGDETVADVGAGSGYFAFRFAKALPKGRVVAIDVEPEMVRHIHHKAMTEGVANVSVVFGDPSDPKIPAGAGLVFVCDVLHHVHDRGGWLHRMFDEVQPGARLVIVEFKEGDLPQGPPAAMKLRLDEVVQLANTAGFANIASDTSLLPYQYVLTFRKP